MVDKARVVLAYWKLLKTMEWIGVFSKQVSYLQVTWESSWMRSSKHLIRLQSRRIHSQTRLYQKIYWGLYLWPYWPHFLWEWSNANYGKILIWKIAFIVAHSEIASPQKPFRPPTIGSNKEWCVPKQIIM
jgi:hypothetical protein